MNLNATLIIEVVSFLLLLFILTKLLYRPLLKFMDERQKAVKEMIENARHSQQQAQEYAGQTHKALDMAKEEALKIKEETRSISDSERRKIIEEAKRESRRLIDDARRQLDKERGLMIKELRAEVALISLDIARKILGREIKSQDHQRLIEESITEIEDALPRA